VKTYGVVFAPEAEDDLAELYDYIAEHGSPTVAARYTEAIIEYCEGLASFAHRGTRRDDIRLGLRITNYKRRAVIAFEVNEGSNTVAILGKYVLDTTELKPDDAATPRKTPWLQSTKSTFKTKPKPSAISKACAGLTARFARTAAPSATPTA
jgi:toxin ParE1/3/4